jgi:hypothetical protein
LAYPVPYGLLYRYCQLRKIDHEQFIHKSVKGFPGADLIRLIRRQPSTVLLYMMERRLRRFSQARLSWRTEVGEALRGALPTTAAIPAAAAEHHRYWVFPIMMAGSDHMIEWLRARGFDGTKTATLRAITAPESHGQFEPTAAQAALERMLYLPVYADFSPSAKNKLVQLLRQYAQEHLHADPENPLQQKLESAARPSIS